MKTKTNMITPKPTKKNKIKLISSPSDTKVLEDPKFFDRLWDESWTYIKTVVDVLREPVLILNKELCILAANEPFLEIFEVKKIDTIGEHVYNLGNGQWNIPELRKLLNEILPKHTFFKGYQVAHTFPTIGRKVMLLNARQIFFRDGTTNELISPIILLAIEDISKLMDIAEKMKGQKDALELLHLERTNKLEAYTLLLEKKIENIIRKQKESLAKKK